MPSRDIGAGQPSTVPRRYYMHPGMGSRGTRPMVDWDSKERGYPIEADSSLEGLYLSCRACRRSVRITWAEVLKRWAVGTYTRDIARSLKCSECGARQGSIMVWTQTPDERVS